MKNRSLAIKLKAIIKNKPLFALLIVTFTVLLTDIAYGIYVAITIARMSAGVILYPSSMTVVSIVALVVNAVYAVAMVLYFVLRKR